MRRKLIKILLGLIGLLLCLFSLYGLWAWVQTSLTAALQSGALRTGDLGGPLLLPPSPLVYGLLAGFFLLVTFILIWVIYRLVATDNIPPDN